MKLSSDKMAKVLWACEQVVFSGVPSVLVCVREQKLYVNGEYAGEARASLGYFDCDYLINAKNATKIVKWMRLGAVASLYFSEHGGVEPRVYVSIPSLRVKQAIKYSVEFDILSGRFGGLNVR